MDNQQAAAKPASKTKRIIVATALGLGVVTVIAIVLAIFASSTDYSDDVSVLSAQQLEAVRIANIGREHDNASQTVKNYGIIVETSVRSANQRIRSLPGSVPSSSIQEMYRDTSVESTLDDAASINRFNPKFLEIIEAQLTAVLNQSGLVLTKVPEKDKALMQGVVDETQLLLDELPT